MSVNALKLARMECGITQLDLAKRLGTSEKMVSFWETGRCKPHIEQAVDIARILSIDPERIFPEMFGSTEISKKTINYD